MVEIGNASTADNGTGIYHLQQLESWYKQQHQQRWTAAAAPKLISKRVVINAELTWHYDDTMYKKVFDITKAEKKETKTNKL